jgi:DNA-binding PadR family transcriptional regulator
VKSIQDFLILAVLEEHENLTGYQVMHKIHDKLGIHLSAGTIYGTLYALEREQLVEAVAQPNCRTYLLTSKGETKLRGVGEIARTFNHLISTMCGKHFHAQPECDLSR